MKISTYRMLLMSAMALMTGTAAFAQDHDDKYWERRREDAKKRDEYYRERDKKADEYYRERDKKYAEYEREERKREKEYYKELSKRNKHAYKGRNHWHNSRPPAWAVRHDYYADHHVYFRDYDTFYDPYRGGYVYRYANDWRFSRDIPTFLASVDLGRARVQIMADIPLTKRPEQYYDSYRSRYPRNPRVQVNVY